MCVIERKTYLHTDGTQETIEKARPCHRAVGSRLCKNVDRRSFEAARVVEKRPATTTTRSKSDEEGYIVTEGSRGQQRMYRDLSKRSSNSSSMQRTMSDHSTSTPVSTASSASSPSYVELKPYSATSPSLEPGFPFEERTRAPYSSVPRPSFTKEGTAIYERPPSPDQPRATANERPRLSRQSSFSSVTAEVDDREPTSSTQGGRRSRVSIDTNPRPATPSSATSAAISSPGLSSIRSSMRRDSGNELGRRASQRHRSDSEKQRRKDREEDERQARIARDRLADSDRRQSAREQLARDASRERRERNRQDAAAALEGASTRDDAIERGREAERAEMQRERERAQQLRRGEEAARQYYDDQLRRDADARARYEEAARRPQILPPQPTSPALSTRSPITSARAFGNTTALQTIPSRAMQPRLHQEVPPPASDNRRGQTISERGADVIARERARAAGRDLNEALGDLNLQGPEAEAEEYQARTRGRYEQEERYRYGQSGKRYR